jgi:hypothetical protein
MNASKQAVHPQHSFKNLVALSLVSKIIISLTSNDFDPSSLGLTYWAVAGHRDNQLHSQCTSYKVVCHHIGTCEADKHRTKFH